MLAYTGILWNLSEPFIPRFSELNRTVFRVKPFNLEIHGINDLEHEAMQYHI